MNSIAGIPTKTLSLASCIGIVLLICGLVFHSSLLSAIAVAFVSVTVIGLIASVILPAFLNRTNSPYPAPEPIWSRGNYGIADHVGDNSEDYVRAGTESKVKSLLNLRGKRGIIWIRTGSYLPNDIDTFVRDSLPYLSGKTILITTDGDLTVPEHLNENVVSAILENENIVAWYTQNMSMNNERKMYKNQNKLRAFPIGLDLHSMKGNEPEEIWQKYQTIKSQYFVPWDQRQNKIFSDVHLTKSKCGTRERWRKSMDLLNSSRMKLLEKRISRENLWSHFYCGIKFVMSLPGNGLDCHRTYEAAFFGAVIVTTASSPFKQLWEKMNVPVVYCLDDFSDVIQKVDSYQKPLTSELKFFTVTEWRQEMDSLLF